MEICLGFHREKIRRGMIFHEVLLKKNKSPIFTVSRSVSTTIFMGSTTSSPFLRCIWTLSVNPLVICLKVLKSHSFEAIAYGRLLLLRVGGFERFVHADKA